MTKLTYSKHFHRKVKSLIKGDKDLFDSFLNCIGLLCADINNPKLKSHKVISRKTEKSAIAVSVTGSIRILYEISPDQIDCVHLVDIGPHDGSKKVYVTSSN